MGGNEREDDAGGECRGGLKHSLIRCMDTRKRGEDQVWAVQRASTRGMMRIERERERGRRQRREQDETRKGAVGYFAPSPSSFSGHLLADSAEKL